MTIPWPIHRWLVAALIVVFVCSSASAEWKEKVLYSFQGGSDGTYPAGGVVFDQAGNLYGATGWDGSTGIGTVFQLTKQGGTWKKNLLYAFHGSDGSIPTGGVVLDKAENIYGGTAYGGTGHCVLLGSDVGCGLIYEISPPVHAGAAWTETIIYSFQGDKDGYFPQGDLVFDSAGNLYGATQFGGGFGSCDPFYPFCGTIFELSPPKKKGGKWTERVLYSFKNKKDGADPNGGLALDENGALYGTTYCGGSAECQNLQSGNGVVFRLKPPTTKGGRWNYQLLYTFKGRPSDGSGPRDGVALDKKGNLYGTTVGGGSNQGGVIFQLIHLGRQNGAWTENILHSFTVGDGYMPWSAPIVREGNLYGTASSSKQAGTVFRLNQPATQGKPWKYTVLYEFEGPPDGWSPQARVVFNGERLYSTTQTGGTGLCSPGCGTVFEVSP